MKYINHSGWGRTHKSHTQCFEVEEFNSTIQSITTSGLAIGLGRSYGDSSINSNGVYFASGAKKRIKVNAIEKIALCESGVTIGELERAALAHGLFPPTVPGTEFVTIGGAIASNIHGKSHHSEGSFGSSVLEIKLLTSSGQSVTLSPKGKNQDQFWATVGGMGLTGIITEATISLREVQTSYVTVQEKRASNLEELISLINEFDKKFSYTVAWVDISGKYTGRGKVAGANHAKISDLPKKKADKPLETCYPKNFVLPDIFPSMFINWITVFIFNNFWYRKPLTKGVVKIRPFLHPLDFIKNWNRIYGKGGFIQYQIQIPFGKEKFLEEVFMEMKKIKAASFLSVIKKFGESDNSYIGFPSPGWTIAIDIPAKHKNIAKSLNDLNEKLCLIGGRVYLSKDSVLTAELFNKMYPNAIRWAEIKKDLDPANYWCSDQGVRLGLC